MNKFKSICALLVLALSLSLPVYADTTPGDGHTPGSASGGTDQLPPPEIHDSIIQTTVTDNGVIVVNVILAVIGLA